MLGWLGALWASNRTLAVTSGLLVEVFLRAFDRRDVQIALDECGSGRKASNDASQFFWVGQASRTIQIRELQIYAFTNTYPMKH